MFTQLSTTVDAEDADEQTQSGFDLRVLCVLRGD
jgi:hypothetical protein